MKQCIKVVFVAAAALALAASSYGANNASDSALDPAYSGVWTNGSNGGTGFGAWQLSPGVSGPNAGHFIGNSTGNGDGADDGNVGGLPLDRDIGLVAWGMYANSGSAASAIRPFTGGALAAGQSFSVEFDNGWIDPGSQISIGLLDVFFNPVFRVTFTGGGSFYSYTDNSGTFATSVGYGDEGLKLTFNMLSGLNYSATLTRKDGATDTWSGTLGAAPEAFGAANFNAGPGSNYDLFINTMSIVPEPSTLALAAMGVLGIAARALRRREG